MSRATSLEARWAYARSTFCIPLIISFVQNRLSLPPALPRTTRLNCDASITIPLWNDVPKPLRGCCPLITLNTLRDRLASCLRAELESPPYVQTCETAH